MYYPSVFSGGVAWGTHVHVFSPDGKWLSFTYNDHVMHELDVQLDQRNVAIAVPIGPVNVSPKIHFREYSGDYFCCVVTRTTQQPKPSSDEISRAYEEGWVGQKGYQKENGEWQEERWCLLVTLILQMEKLFLRSILLIYLHSLRIT